MLEYKLKRYGIRFIKQEESYTSQCSPLSPEVGKGYAEPSKRKERGLYRDGNRTYNADAVGAYNILRKYHSVSGVKRELSVTGLKTPEIIKVAVNDRTLGSVEDKNKVRADILKGMVNIILSE